MTTPYKSKFQESYDIDSFNAFLEKEVPGFGGPGPEDKKKANEYFRKLIQTLESYIKGNEEDLNNDRPLRLSGKFKEPKYPEQVQILVDELMDSGLDPDLAYEIAIDFVSGDERRNQAYERMEGHPAINVLKEYESDDEYNSIFPGT